MSWRTCQPAVDELGEKVLYLLLYLLQYLLPMFLEENDYLVYRVWITRRR